MDTLTLTPAQRRELRSMAHHLDPVVMIGQHGVTSAVLHEIDNALNAHELIKVRMFADEREVRAAALADVCEKLSAGPVQTLGKLFIIYRPRSDAAEEAHSAKPNRRAKPKEVERPRYTDFKPEPAAKRAKGETRPPARDEAPRKRTGGGGVNDNPWSELPISTRRRIDPNFVETDAMKRRDPAKKKPVSARKMFAAKTENADVRRRAPVAGEFAIEQARKKRAQAAAAETGEPINPPRAIATEERFRWKDRDKWPTAERAPRPSTRATPALSKRGAARNPSAPQTRRRLREDY
jgi:putative YhbY family RNA-binding protein